jgi:hypothetical protein
MAIIDYRNNVIYNWGNANACYGGEVNIAGGVSQVNLVNNYYKPGPATTGAELKFVHANYNAKEAKGTGEWYLNGNIMEGDKALTKKNFKGLDLTEEGYPKKAEANDPFTISAAIPEQNAKDAFDAVLKNAGAVLPKRDATDNRVIEETRTGKATGMGVFGKAGIIDLPNAVGGWASYQSSPAPVDTDEDGMPDEWEKKNGLNPADASDGNKVGGDGFTMLEKYLNELAIVK